LCFGFLPDNNENIYIKKETASGIMRQPLIILSHFLPDNNGSKSQQKNRPKISLKSIFRIVYIFVFKS